MPQFANPAEYLLEYFQNLPENMKDYNYKIDVPEDVYAFNDIEVKDEFKQANFFTQ